VTDTTHVVLAATAGDSVTRPLLFAPPFIISVDSTTQVTMNVPALATTSTGTASIGCSHQGYPLFDQGGRGYFAAANAGDWPNQASYTDANYQKLMGDYTWANTWRGTPGGSWSNPPASSADRASTAGYLQPNREFYNPVAYAIWTTPATPLTEGTAIGTLANIPTDCTTGVGYWAVDDGPTLSVSYVYPNGGSTFTKGRLYKCTSTDMWEIYYTPLGEHSLAGGAPEPPAASGEVRVPRSFRVN
jgi:hypothetical protein